MRVNPFLYGVLTVVILLGVVYAAQSAGFWSTDRKYTATGDKVQADPTDVDTIRGWMTLGDISRVYKVPVAEILAQFKLPADTPPSTGLKKLKEANPDFEISELRAWLAKRLKVSK